MSSMAQLLPRTREALDAVTAVINAYADVFRPTCENDGDDCPHCSGTVHLSGWVLVHEWTALEDDSVSAAYHTGIGTGYHQAIGLLTRTLASES